MAGALLGFGVVCLGMGAMLSRRRNGVISVPARRSLPAYGGAEGDQGLGAGGSASAFYRSMLVLVIAATGLCGMALELILIFVFQSLLGYVYSKVGLIVAGFMLGLTLGACGAPRLIRRGARLQWRAMVAMELMLIAEAACIPWLMTGLSSGLMLWIPWGWVEVFIYGLIAVSGALVGAQFALVNELLKNAVPAAADHGAVASGQSMTAAITNAADLMGAALGGLVVGVLLLPLFGIVAACFLLAVMKGASLLCLLAARRVIGVVGPYYK
jgi:spermidine synthase